MEGSLYAYLGTFIRSAGPLGLIATSTLHSDSRYWSASTRTPPHFGPPCPTTLLLETPTYPLIKSFFIDWPIMASIISWWRIPP